MNTAAALLRKAAAALSQRVRIEDDYAQNLIAEIDEYLSKLPPEQDSNMPREKP